MLLVAAAANNDAKMETFGNVIRRFRKPVLCLQHGMGCLAKLARIVAVALELTRWNDGRSQFEKSGWAAEETKCLNGLFNTSCSSSASGC